MSSEKNIAKFKSDMGDRLNIARQNGATYELHSNTPIPQTLKDWLTKKAFRLRSGNNRKGDKMSASASIEIKVAKVHNCKIALIEIIKKLLEFGWTLNDNNKTSYLPLGDNDDFDWKHENISIDNLINIIAKKEQQKETIGIVLTGQDTGIGGSFLFWSEGSISINLNINRKVLDIMDTAEITDINWYFAKILPVLNQGAIQIEAFSYKEHV